MIQQSRTRGNLTAVLRLESILKLTQLWRTHMKTDGDAPGSAGVGSNKAGAIAANSEADRSEELASLLSGLGLSASTTAAMRFGHDSSATARAVTVIVDWMSYLPRDCVRAMVADGWHWTS